MELHVKIIKASQIDHLALSNLILKNFKFLDNLTIEKNREFLLILISNYIRKDCQYAMVAEDEENNVVGVVFYSHRYSKRSIIKDKISINNFDEFKAKMMFNNLINIRNLANIYKYELTYHKRHYLFVDYIFANNDCERECIKAFLRKHFYAKALSDGFKDFFIMNINDDFTNFYKELNWQIVDKQLATNSYFNVFFQMELVHVKFASNKQEEDFKLSKNMIKIFSEWIPLNKMYHISYRSYIPMCQERILLIHGTASSHKTWDHLIPILRWVANVEVIDLPFHGESKIEDYNKFPWDIFTLSIFLRKFLEYHNWNNLIVWGHSLGGGVSICLKELCPYRIKGLILEDPYNSGALENLGKLFLESLKIIFSKQYQELKRIVNKKPKGNWHFKDSYGSINLTVTVFLRKLLSRQIMNYLDWTYFNNTSPSLVCFGKQDIVINANLSKEYFQRFISSHYDFHIIDRSGHSLHHDNPIPFMLEVFKFLEEQFKIDCSEARSHLDTLKDW